MSGLNYDDLGNHLYMSEDYGKNWQSITSNLPDEIANVIIEDPKNENILYAGMYRGVYISTNRGQSWSLLGKDMPNVSVADLEINVKSMDLVVATHGRGLYKVNLNPIHEMMSNNQLNSVKLFNTEKFVRPRFRDTHRDPDYETLTRSTVSFYLPEKENVILSIVNNKDEEIWFNKFDGQKGLNQYRWDLILQRVNQNQPYFFRYDQFINPGRYTLKLTTKSGDLTRTIEVENFNR